VKFTLIPTFGKYIAVSVLFSIWPEYQRHHKHFIEDRDGIHVISGKAQIGNIWKDSVDLIMQQIDEKFAYKLSQAKEHF